MKVLVIEDEPQIRNLLAKFLELLGHEADVTPDGREGLARFNPFVHDIVITDFRMPGFSGLAVAEALRKRCSTTSLMIIIGFAPPHDERRAAVAGLRFLRKPIDFVQFKAMLAEVVAQDEAWRERLRADRGA